MMAGDALYPRGFHPSDPRLSPNAKHYAKKLRRRDVGYLKYYIIDFDISLYFDDPKIRRRRSTCPIQGDPRPNRKASISMAFAQEGRVRRDAVASRYSFGDSDLHIYSE